MGSTLIFGHFNGQNDRIWRPGDGPPLTTAAYAYGAGTHSCNPQKINWSRNYTSRVELVGE